MVLRRACRAAEGRRVAGASVIAPAGHVARAVGTLLVAASTHGLHAAARGAAAGCAPGVARVVDISLARQVLHALPGPPVDVPSYTRVTPACVEDVSGLRRGGGARSSLPPASWWGREPAWSPRVVADSTPGSRDGADSVVAQLWPAAPDVPIRAAPPRDPSSATPSGKRVWAPEDPLIDQAWRVLDDELVPSEWAMAPRNVARGAR